MRKTMRIPILLAAYLILAACTTPPEPRPQAAPGVVEGRLAIGGHVVTPTGVLRDHWIVIENGRIAAIQKERPAGGRVLATSDYVFPGFVDLHNHPMYNVIPRWRPPHQYANRYEWRGDPMYRAAIAAPQAEAMKAGFCDINAYAEVKLLMGGTTSTIGVSKPSSMPTMDKCIAGLARNLDWHTGFHGAAPGNEPVRNSIGITPGDMRDPEPADLSAKLKRGELDLLAIHIAEGRSADPQSRTEFGLLESRGLLTGRTAIIHGIALGKEEFAKMAAAGAALVWSPRSNMALYGETADVLGAIDGKVRVAIAPDWGPSGSDNLLDELAFASSLMRARMDAKRTIGNRQLFEMATKTPAEIARVDKEVGSLAPGLRADLFLLKSTNADAYNALVQTGASAIALVLVDGVPVYGDASNMSALNVARTEAVRVCGIAKAINADSLTAGPLAEVAQRLATVLSANGSALAPLVELCR
jgi:cytosine/adenosine deaminase-related metal-dependent hydrolase